jgi:hypothetical protein
MVSVCRDGSIEPRILGSSQNRERKDISGNSDAEDGIFENLVTNFLQKNQKDWSDW